VRRIFDAVTILLIVGLIGFSVWAWGRLPEQIPTHFGIDGRPDAWSARSLVSWFLIPAFAVAITLVMLGARTLCRKFPQLVNLPSGTRLADMPEPARQPILAELAGFLALVQTQILIIFGIIQVATFRAAMGSESRGLMIAVLVLAILTAPLLLGLFFLRLMPAMETAKKLARNGASP